MTMSHFLPIKMSVAAAVAPMRAYNCKPWKKKKGSEIRKREKKKKKWERLKERFF